MAAKPVEWVMAVFYGTAAHQATYGRHVGQGGYSKDYIQLHRNSKFLAEFNQAFPATIGGARVELTLKWPSAQMPGAFDFSSDRWHLKWETRLGAPAAWKMSLTPSESTAESIPGDPSHKDFKSAENELMSLPSRGAGQPYLFAIKLRGETRTLHLRTYLAKPSSLFAWADLQLMPQSIQSLALSTRRSSAIASSTFKSGGVLPTAAVASLISQMVAISDPKSVVAAVDASTGKAFADYLRNPSHGLFFDSSRNHDAWVQPTPLPLPLKALTSELLSTLESRFPPIPEGDAAAESLETDSEIVASYRKQIDQRNFEVPDATATVKARGNAQRAFAEVVKADYEHRCAITGMRTRDFLVAAHIVPWSKDQSIRLDPANGICLSLFVDRAFEKGYLTIEDDHTIRIDWARVGSDEVLKLLLEPHDGKKLTVPKRRKPKAEYLQRRRALYLPIE
jgi:hypothetical protein